LRDPTTGAVYGPVHPVSRSTVYIGEKEFTLVSTRAQDEESHRVLTSHFPQYDFRGCMLSSAVDDINKMIKAQFPKSKVQIQLLADTFHTQPSPFEQEATTYMPKITFSARDVPLMTVIDILCKISEAHFEINRKTITIRGGHVQQSTRE
jgi:hypothetical protein